MNRITILILGLFISPFIFAQQVADFSFDAKKEVMCYTEYANGISVKNTTVDVKNLATCTGGETNCFYVYSFGETAAQTVKTNKTTTSYKYTKDGEFPLQMQVVNKTSIHDSIKNNTITSVTYNSEVNDSVLLAISYTAASIQKQAIVKIPVHEYATKTFSRPIKVYSPIVDEASFMLEVDDPSTEDKKAAIQSFKYAMLVDTHNFKPHALDMWTYTWSIYRPEDNGDYNESNLLKRIYTSALTDAFTFPEEDFTPGYIVGLTIALDSSKFEYPNDISYYNLSGCVADQTQTIAITDYFFTDATQKKDNILDREAVLPNIFTPGGGDENEVFFFNTNGVDDFSIAIYDSWGNLVFKQTAKTISWTGKNNHGVDCISGVYYYVVSSNKDDKRHEKAGYIHLFRQ